MKTKQILVLATLGVLALGNAGAQSASTPALTSRVGVRVELDLKSMPKKLFEKDYQKPLHLILRDVLAPCAKDLNVAMVLDENIPRVLLQFCEMRSITASSPDSTKAWQGEIAYLKACIAEGTFTPKAVDAPWKHPEVFKHPYMTDAYKVLSDPSVFTLSTDSPPNVILSLSIRRWDSRSYGPATLGGEVEYQPAISVSVTVGKRLLSTKEISPEWPARKSVAGDDVWYAISYRLTEYIRNELKKQISPDAIRSPSQPTTKTPERRVARGDSPD